MNFCALKGYTWWHIPWFTAEDRKQEANTLSTPLPQVIIIFAFLCSRAISEQPWKGFLENKKQTQRICVLTHMALLYQGEEDHRVWQTLKLWEKTLRFAKSLTLELTCSPREAMQDEDGYITLNIKPQKPAVSSGKNVQQQKFGS